MTRPITAGGPLEVPVMVDGWQMECCGVPPEHGATVSWRLDWRPCYASLLPTDFSLAARVEALANGHDYLIDDDVPVRPAIATVGGVSVFTPLTPPLPDTVLLAGVLHEDHHVDSPPETPLTTGTITRVRIVSWEHRATNPAEPVPKSARLTDVDTAPRWFTQGQPDQEAFRWRNETGLLVDLVVDSN